MTSLAGARARSRRVYYGWWVTLTGAINTFFSSGPTFQAQSVLFSALESEFGWSRAVLGGVASFGRFGGALFGPLEGWLTDHFGSSRMVLIGFTAAGLGLIFFSRIQSVPTYYISYFILSLGFSLGGFTPSMAAVNNWMPHRRSTAMSLVLAGSSVGGLSVPLIVWGINTHGWRDTVMVVGIITLVVGPFLAKMLARKQPERASLDRLVRSATRKRRQSGQPAGLGHDFTPGEALRTRAFWAIAMTHTLANLSVSAVSAHLFIHLTDENGVGLGDTAAGTIIVVQTISAFTFQLVGGYVGDRANKRLLISALTFTQGVALVLLALADAYWLALVFGLIWGLGFAGRTPLLHSMRGDYFGRKHYGTILGTSAFPMAIGMSLTPVIVGWASDVQGTYDSALFVLAGACAVASLVIQFATRPTPPAPGARTQAAMPVKEPQTA